MTWEPVCEGDGLFTAYVYNAKKERIRLIGVDTPETVHPSKAVQPYGPEASNYAKKALDGREIWLEFDVKPRDRYGKIARLCLARSDAIRRGDQ